MKFDLLIKIGHNLIIKAITQNNKGVFYVVFGGILMLQNKKGGHFDRLKKYKKSGLLKCKV